MAVYPALTDAVPLEGYQLALTFAGNEKRIYDFTPHLSHKFYRSLADIKLFKNVSVVDGEIIWVTGQDFCPHTLYEQSVPIS
jgi:hypothetical protein